MSHAKIREREIIYRGRETGWSGQRTTEYQLVAGGKILSRHETRPQAEKALREMQKADR